MLSPIADTRTFWGTHTQAGDRTHKLENCFLSADGRTPFHYHRFSLCWCFEALPKFSQSRTFLCRSLESGFRQEAFQWQFQIFDRRIKSDVDRSRWKMDSARTESRLMDSKTLLSGFDRCYHAFFICFRSIYLSTGDVR